MALSFTDPASGVAKPAPTPALVCRGAERPSLGARRRAERIPSGPGPKEVVGEPGDRSASSPSPNSRPGRLARPNRQERAAMGIAEGEVFVGIDVAKRRLDVHVLPEDAAEGFDHDATGLAQLVAWLAERRPTLVVLEATGGLQLRAAAELATAGLPTAVVNPRQVRDFARSGAPLPIRPACQDRPPGCPGDRRRRRRRRPPPPSVRSRAPCPSQSGRRWLIW
jgi:Transposase